MPSGRLAICAYSPYLRVNWGKTWQEKNVGELSQKLKSIVKEIEAAVPTIVQRREEAQKQAELDGNAGKPNVGNTNGNKQNASAPKPQIEPRRPDHDRASLVACVQFRKFLR